MKKIILFAGAVGCSKTPTANYLSCQLNLPVFNNDAIRIEVVEDFGNFNEEEYLRRRDERLRQIIESGISFILDASIDREFLKLKEVLLKSGYEFFVVSFDLSKEFLRKLYQYKKYEESLTILDQLFLDHENFLKINQNLIGLQIKDKDFSDRLEMTLSGVKRFLDLK